LLYSVREKSRRRPPALVQSRLTTILKILAAVGLLGYLVYLVEPSRLWAVARRAEGGWIAAAVLLLPANLALEGLMWQWMARVILPGIGFRKAMASVLCGHPLGTFTPARVGEMAGRAFYLDYEDKWELGAAVFAQRMYDMVAAVDVGLLALGYFVLRYHPDPPVAWQAVFVFGVGTALTLTVLALQPGWAHAAVRWLTERETIRRRAAFLSRLSGAGVGRILGGALARYGVYITQFVLIARAFAPGFRMPESVLAPMLVIYAKFLIPSLTFMDVGVREGAAVYFFSTLGFEQAVAFNAAFLLFVVNMLASALLGLPLALRIDWRRAVSD
jgi:uncharacterized membrane protein YbhN (UPF0104 family)